MSVIVSPKNSIVHERQSVVRYQQSTYLIGLGLDRDRYSYHGAWWRSKEQSTDGSRTACVFANTGTDQQVTYSRARSAAASPKWRHLTSSSGSRSTSAPVRTCLHGRSARGEMVLTAALAASLPQCSHNPVPMYTGGSKRGRGPCPPSIPRLGVWSVAHSKFINILDTNMNESNASTFHHII